MRLPALLIAVPLTACGTQPSAATTPSTSTSATKAMASPSAIPSSSGSRSYGVFVDQTSVTYTISLISPAGGVAAKVQAAVPTAYRFTHFTPAPPLVSVSGTGVYYADGAAIKFMSQGGSTRTVMPYPGGPQTAAGFAVSPDDRRIAVALLAFRSSDNFQASLDLYVEDLGGANRTEIFSSTSVSEWPIAWSNGKLVLAVGPAVVGNAPSNPYNGFEGYHVIDPTTGNRLVTMRADCLFGPLTPEGTACDSAGSGVGAQAFDGRYRAFVPTGSAQLFLALSPDGSEIAGRPGALGSPIVLFHSTGESASIGVSGVPMGWIDGQHLVYYGPNGFQRSMVEVASRSVTSLPACLCGNPGVYFGSLSVAA